MLNLFHSCSEVSIFRLRYFFIIGAQLTEFSRNCLLRTLELEPIAAIPRSVEDVASERKMYGKS